MLASLSWLALEVKYLGRSRAFYEDRLGLAPVRTADAEVVYAAGETDVVLRPPGDVPRGGLHVHYAFSTPPDAYGAWRERLAGFDPESVSFGRYESLYVDDPDDHCVEVGNNGERDGDGGRGGDRNREAGADEAPLTGVFEVVLEVESIARSRPLYESLGFDVVDEGERRPRVRLRGPFDLELWEPQLGLADARGGVHVDLGFETTDHDAAVDAVCDEALAVEGVDGGTRIRDPDGHYLTFLE